MLLRPKITLVENGSGMNIEESKSGDCDLREQGFCHGDSGNSSEDKGQKNRFSTDESFEEMGLGDKCIEDEGMQYGRVSESFPEAEDGNSDNRGSGCSGSREGVSENSSSGNSSSEDQESDNQHSEDQGSEDQGSEDQGSEDRGSEDTIINIGIPFHKENIPVPPEPKSGENFRHITEEKTNHVEETDQNSNCGTESEEVFPSQVSPSGEEHNDGEEEAQVTVNVVVAADSASEAEVLFRDSVTPSIKLFVFNIVLPTMDIYLDTVLIWKLFTNSYWGSGIFILAGIATNFIFTCLAWWRLESPSQKKWSWIFLLFQLWPQLRALQVQIFCTYPKHFANQIKVGSGKVSNIVNQIKYNKKVQK